MLQITVSGKLVKKVNVRPQDSGAYAAFFVLETKHFSDGELRTFAFGLWCKEHRVKFLEKCLEKGSWIIVQSNNVLMLPHDDDRKQDMYAVLEASEVLYF